MGELTTTEGCLTWTERGLHFTACRCDRSDQDSTRTNVICVDTYSRRWRVGDGWRAISSSRPSSTFPRPPPGQPPPRTRGGTRGGKGGRIYGYRYL